MVRVYKRKTEDKRDQDTLRMAISAFRENKTSLNSVAKNYGVSRATLQFWLHKDFPTPGLQSKGRFKIVFTPYLETQLREHAVTLRKMFYGGTGMDMRKLAIVFAGRIIFIIHLISKENGWSRLASFMKSSNLSLRTKVLLNNRGPQMAKRRLLLFKFLLC